MNSNARITEHVEVDIPKDVMDRIRAAAELRGCTVAEYLLDAIDLAADRTLDGFDPATAPLSALSDPRVVIPMSPEAWAAIETMIETQKGPNQALAEAIALHARDVISK